MPLLKNNELIQDPWVIIDLEQPEPLPEAPVLIAFADLPKFLENKDFNYPIGVLFPADTDIEALTPYLNHLSLIALIFPSFKDGRAFSQARKIRQQLKFTGEIRATGHILPDQYQFLIRTGFSSVSLPETADFTVWEKAVHSFTIAYQPALGQEKRLQGLHWRI